MKPAISAETKEWWSFYARVVGAGSFAGGVMVLGLNPLDVWRTRLQTSKGIGGVSGKGELRGLMQNRKLFLRGMTCNTIRNCPGNGLYFATHEYLTQLFATRDGFGITSKGVRAVVVGGLTGIIFNTALYPVDVIKCLQQVEGNSGTVADNARAVFKERGWRGFYRGLSVSTVRAVPVNASAFGALHMARTMLDYPAPE